MRFSYEGDPAAARALLGRAQHELARQATRMAAEGRTSTRFTAQLSATAYCYGYILPTGLSAVHVVAPVSADTAVTQLKTYFEFGASGLPVDLWTWTSGDFSASAYNGCVVQARLTIVNGVVVPSAIISGGARYHTLADASLIARPFQVALLDEPTGYLHAANAEQDGEPVQVYADAVMTTYAPTGPYTGLYTSSLNLERPGFTNTEQGLRQCFNERDVGYDVVFGLSRAGAATQSAVLTTVDWPRATGIQEVTHPTFGGRTFAVYIDASFTVSVFPFSAVGPLTMPTQNVAPSLVKTATIPYPEWAFIPPDTAQAQYAADGEHVHAWMLASPDLKWTLNHLGTKACCVLHEREAAVWDDAYLTDPDTKVHTAGFNPTNKSNLMGHTGTANRWGFNESNAEVYTYGRGVFELSIAITLTGPGIKDFSLTLSGNVIRAPRDSPRATYMAAYAWYDVEAVGVLAGDLILLDLERWYQPDPVLAADDQLWKVVWTNDTYHKLPGPLGTSHLQVVKNIETMSATALAAWLDESGRGSGWAATVSAQVAALVAARDADLLAYDTIHGPPDPLDAVRSEMVLSWNTLIDRTGVGTEMPGFYENSDPLGPGGNGLKPYSGDLLRAIAAPSVVLGGSKSFFSLRQWRAGTETEIRAIPGEALLAIDLKTVSLVTALEEVTFVERTLAAGFNTPGDQTSKGWTATADMPHRVSHPGVAVFVQGQPVSTLTPEGMDAGIVTALQAQAASDPRASLDGSWSYLPANDLRDWSAYPKLRDHQLAMNAFTDGFPVRLDFAHSGFLNPLQNLSVQERNWWLAGMCVNSSCPTLLLVTKPNFGWAMYTSEVISRTQNAYTTFFVHPNGSWAYYDPLRIYNTHGVPDLFRGYDSDNVSAIARYDPVGFPAARYLLLDTSTIIFVDVALDGHDDQFYFPTYPTVQHVNYLLNEDQRRMVINTAFYGPTESSGQAQMRKFVNSPNGPVRSYPSGSAVTIVNNDDPGTRAYVYPKTVNVFNDYDSLSPAVANPTRFTPAIFDAMQLKLGTKSCATTFRAQYNAAVAALTVATVPPLVSAEVADLRASLAVLGSLLSTTHNKTSFTLLANWGGATGIDYNDGAFRNKFDGGSQLATLAATVDGVGKLLKLRLHWFSSQQPTPPTFSTCLLESVND